MANEQSISKFLPGKRFTLLGISELSEYVQGMKYGEAKKLYWEEKKPELDKELEAAIAKDLQVF